VPSRPGTKSDWSVAPYGRKTAEIELSVAFKVMAVKGERVELSQLGFWARAAAASTSGAARVASMLGEMAAVGSRRAGQSSRSPPSL